MSKVIATFRKGTTPMDSDFIEYRKEGDLIIERCCGMGGQSEKPVDNVPKKIKGYKKI